MEQSVGRNPVEELAEEFLERQRRGEKPTVAEYVAKHPELADEIRELFPALQLLEDIGRDSILTIHAPPAGPSPALTQLGEYRILRELGRGGMGVVYEAEQETLGRRVALKVLPALALKDEQRVRRFEREARAVARLHHTNIVPVFGIGQWRERETSAPVYFYVMQFIPGLGLDGVLEQLKQMLAAHPKTKFPVAANHETTTENLHAASRTKMTERADSDPLASQIPASSDLSSVIEADRRYWVSVAQIGVQVADALAHAHSQGVLHRDIKPSNLLLDLKGNVWVTDFGLAKVAQDDDLTNSGDIVGTVRYMAPERFNGQADARSDIYSLGLTLYELLTLRPAIDEPERFKMMHAILHEEPPRPRRVNPLVPVDLETVVLKAIARDPASRYSSAAELVDDLRRFIEDRPIQARRTSPLERAWRWSRRNPGVVVALAAVFGTLLLAAAVSAVFACLAHSSEKQAKANEEEARLEQHQAELARVDAEDARGVATSNQYYAEMILAGQVADAPGGIGRLTDLLPKWRPAPGQRDRRGWEWHYLHGLCSRPWRTLLGHVGEVTAVDCSPDGQTIASAGADGTIRLWNAATGRQRLVLRGHGNAVQVIRFRPDGRLLVSADAKGVVHWWDVDTGIPLAVVVNLDSVANDLCWSPDGKRLAVACDDHSIRIWVTATRKPALPALRGHTNPVLTLSWNRDGKRLASGSVDHTIRIWNTESGECLATLQGHRNPVESVAWHPDGNRLASGSFDATVRVWHADEAEQPAVLRQHVNGVRCVRWSPDGKQLASAAQDHTVRLWDADSLAETTVLRGHIASVNAIRWRPDGQTLASGGCDGRVLLWKADSRDESNAVLAQEGLASSISWNPDGKRLAVAARQRMRIWDTETRRQIASLSEQDWVNAVAWSPDGRRLALGDRDGSVRLADPAGRIEDVVLAAHKGWVQGVTWSPDGTRLATIGRSDAVVRIWDAHTGRRLDELESPGRGLRSVCWCPAGRYLAYSVQDGAVRVWDTETATLAATLRGHSKLVHHLCWNHDGSRLATGGDDGLIVLWNVSSWTAAATLRGHTSAVYGLAWSPDDSRLASSSQDRTVKLWDTATGHEALSLRGHNDFAVDVRWSPDGRRLASASYDGTVRLWDARPGYAAEEAAR